MSQNQHKYLPILFFLLMLIIGLAHNHSISLWDQDEAAYAGFAKHMVESGNWLIPEFIWSDHHRKPPLHFWNIALCYKLFGVNEFSVRLPSALSILAVYLLLFFWGGRLFGRRLAFISTIILSTTYFTPLLSKVSVTDATLLLFSTICALSIVEVLKHKSGWSVLSFWLAFALALLTKGPPILLFSGVFTGLLLLLHPQRKRLILLHPWFFLPVACLPLFLWGYYASLEDGGELVRWMIDFYILKRMDGAVMGQSLPPGFHLLMIFGFFSSYLLFYPAVVKSVMAVRTQKWNDYHLFVTWFIAGWLLYEFSATKLPAYTIVSHVALSFLIGKSILSAIQESKKPSTIWVVLHISLLILIAVALVTTAFILELSIGLKITCISWLCILLVGCLWSLGQAPRNFIKGMVVINLLFQSMLWLVVLPQIDAYKNSSWEIGQYIAQHNNRERTIVLGNNLGHPPSLPFYASLTYSNILEQTDPRALLGMLNDREPYVFILNSEQRGYLEKADPSLSFKSFESYFVDRQGTASYHVLFYPPVSEE